MTDHFLQPSKKARSPKRHQKIGPAHNLNNEEKNKNKNKGIKT
jgi:hypothetical protein